MPGPEIQAAAIATALADFPLDDAPNWLDWLLIVALAAVAPLVGLRFGTAIGLVAWIVAVAAFLGRRRCSRSARAWSISIVPPLAAAFVGLVGSLLLANPVAHPRFNRFLDAVSLAGRDERPDAPPPRRHAAGDGGRCRGSRLGLPGARRPEQGRALDRRPAFRDPRPASGRAPSRSSRSTTRPSTRLGSEQLPFDRGRHARVIRQLSEAGAKVIVYDVQFTEESNDRRGGQPPDPGLAGGRKRRALHDRDRRRREHPHLRRRRGTGVQPGHPGERQHRQRRRRAHPARDVRVAEPREPADRGPRDR